MAKETAQQEAPQQQDIYARSPYAPVNLAERAAEKARILAEQAANRNRLLDCLDPTVAKSYEEKKVLYEWNVQCQVFQPARGREHAHMERFEHQVVAQNERDAWSVFCDKIGEWPSRRDSAVKITKLHKRTLRDSTEPAEAQG